MKIFLWGVFLLAFSYNMQAQQGLLSGSVLDEAGKALEGASVQLITAADSNQKFSTATDKNGLFQFDKVPLNLYRLRVSYVGLITIHIDSINVRADRYDFNLGDIILKQRASDKMDEVIIYAEKPIIQTKDGNITFNTSESALSNSSNASDLLANAPLVTKDPDGKVLVRGKEPKILIDDKPVNLNLQQMQDLLESIPGSSIEKIEVMTNPPAQYANEEGGVINIVTKKGTVGMGGRITAFAGTRGDQGLNGNFNYRKKGTVLNVNGGFARNNFAGYGYSIRENQYTDSITHFNTNNNYANKNIRPNARVNFDYELNKFNALNLVLQYNNNDYNNNNNTYYRNLNRYDQVYRFSNRNIISDGSNANKSLSFTYTLKTATPGENFRIHANYSLTGSGNNRLFYQQFLNPDATYTGLDSTQTQLTDNDTRGYNIQLSYDKPLRDKKTSFSLGAAINATRSDIETDAAYKRKTDGKMVGLDLLSNHFIFTQQINNLRASVKHTFSPKTSIVIGMAGEHTKIGFDFFKNTADTSNGYWTPLPFANFNKSWKDVWNLNLKYRRSIRRPGIFELNPTVDFSDPYNTRFGNPGLEASTAHNFDLVLGRNKSGFYLNFGLGYNIVEDIFSQIRTLMPDGRTEITWQNSSGRKEYETSIWSGYTINKKLRFNLSGSYTYNQYSDFDKTVRKFRDGGSLTSNINSNYTIKDLYTFTGNFTLNRFANPQGSVRSSASMNLGIQARFLNKKMTVSLNAIDPFTQQQNRTFTYGRNFVLENFNSTKTKSFRLSVSYNLTKTVNSKKSKDLLKKASNMKK